MAEQMEWYRGFLISPAFMGYGFEHPKFDPENDLDWRHGHGNTVQECKDDIDRLIAEDAEWNEAVEMVKSLISPAERKES